MRGDSGTLISGTNVVGFLSENLQSTNGAFDIVTGSDIHPSNLEVSHYMPADHGEDFQIKIFFEIILQIICHARPISHCPLTNISQCHTEHSREMGEISIDGYSNVVFDEEELELNQYTLYLEIEFINNICEELHQDMSDFTEEDFSTRN